MKDALLLRSDDLRDTTRAELRTLVARSAVVRLRRGSYLRDPMLEALDVHKLKLVAALNDQVTPSVVSHVSAAVLWKLPIWGAPLEAVHLTKMRRNAGRRAATLEIHTTPLEPIEIVERAGFRVTSPARTLLDLACSANFEAAVVTVDAALHRGLVTPQQLDAVLATAYRRHGRSKAARVFAFADGRSESVGESRSRVSIHVAGLPAPGLQCEILRPDGTFVGRSDFDWGDLLGEFDGMSKYARGRRPGEELGDVVLREKLREDELRELGHGMVRWTWPEIGTTRMTQRLERKIRMAGGR
jgi:hypothetical protein